MSVIIEQIERRARLEHGGDFNKAAEAYFRDHPDYSPEYRAEVLGLNKRAGEDRYEVDAIANSRINMVAARDNLDLTKPADKAAATQKVFFEDPGLWKRHRAANTLRVGARS